MQRFNCPYRNCRAWQQIEGSTCRGRSRVVRRLSTDAGQSRDPGSSRIPGAGGQLGTWRCTPIIESYAIRFESMDDPYHASGLQTFAHWGDDTGQAAQELRTPIQPEENVVLVGQQVSAIDVGEILIGRLSAIVSGHGSPLSHAAILARTLGIPR